MTIDLLQKQD